MLNWLQLQETVLTAEIYKTLVNLRIPHIHRPTASLEYFTQCGSLPCWVLLIESPSWAMYSFLNHVAGEDSMHCLNSPEKMNLLKPNVSSIIMTVVTAKYPPRYLIDCKGAQSSACQVIILNFWGCCAVLGLELELCNTISHYICAWVLILCICRILLLNRSLSEDMISIMYAHHTGVLCYMEPCPYYQQLRSSKSIKISWYSILNNTCYMGTELQTKLAVNSN